MTLGQKPQLQFLEDSVSLGKEVKVSVSFSHPASRDVFFAQNAEFFVPFELLEIDPIETITEDGISKDSVVYTVKTFDVHPIQTLQLPIWEIVNGDSTKQLSNKDSVFIKFLIPDSLLDNSQFITRSNYLPTSSKVNFPLLFRWTIVFFAFVAFFFIFLKRPLEKQWLKWQFRRKHYRFTQQFRKSMKSAENLPASMELWKNHMEWLEDKPYATLSTSEITKQSGDERLGEALKEIDGAIYGGLQSDRILIALQILYNVTLDRFQIKRSNYYKSLN